MRIIGLRACQPKCASPPDWRTSLGQILVAIALQMHSIKIIKLRSDDPILGKRVLSAETELYRARVCKVVGGRREPSVGKRIGGGARIRRRTGDLVGSEDW